MTEKTVIAGQDIALSIQVSTQVGDEKAGTLKGIGFTTGVPLEWDLPKINEVLDKIVAVIDRQQRKADLVSLDRGIKSDYLQLEGVIEQQRNHLNDCQKHWTERGKHGEFSMNDKQRADYNQFETSIKGLREKLAKKEKMFEEWRERCR